MIGYRGKIQGKAQSKVCFLPDSLTVLRISLNWKGEPKQADELTKEKTEPAQGE